MSKCTKGKLEIKRLGGIDYLQIYCENYCVFEICTKDSNGFEDAKELVRRWNAFEEGELVEELRTACLVIKGMVGNVDHTKGHGENSAKMRGDILNSIRELVEAALAKS